MYTYTSRLGGKLTGDGVHLVDEAVLVPVQALVQVTMATVLHQHHKLA